ncbi:MAG: response regulator [Synergistaceae bacterium]|jgi:putative two-component system response regulator|nr:response regulator [Synergistaceae bacterium]
MNRALVIDDDPALLKIVERQLNGLYETSISASGEDALKFLAKGIIQPDIILLDIDMPGLDGYETLARLKEIPDARDIPVIFLTGLTEAENQVKGLTSGAADYITKPFEKEILLARLRLRVDEGQKIREQRKRAGDLVELDAEKFDALTACFAENEKAVARQMALGFPNQEIAENLSFSLSHVKHLTVKILSKTDAANRYEFRKLVIKNN